MFIQDKLDSHTTAYLQPASSLRDITYSCGACGYALNLSSSNRNTANITSKYAKSIRKGTVSFYSIDETRFVRAEELRCRPYFNSAGSWGLFRRRTRLLCRKCGARIGYASASRAGSGSIDWKGVAGDSKYEIRIAALQPTEDNVSGVRPPDWFQRGVGPSASGVRPPDWFQRGVGPPTKLVQRVAAGIEERVAGIEIAKEVTDDGVEAIDEISDESSPQGGYGSDQHLQVVAYHGAER